VTFEHPHPMKLIAHLESEGIRAGTLAPGVVRFATHLDVDDADIERAVRAVASAP
jgi:kynureninase